MYAGDGEMEIDNNLVENAIRPNAIGKKNWLFFGSENRSMGSLVPYKPTTAIKKSCFPANATPSGLEQLSGRKDSVVISH